MLVPRVILDNYPNPTLAHYLYLWIADQEYSLDGNIYVRKGWSTIWSINSHKQWEVIMSIDVGKRFSRLNPEWISIIVNDHMVRIYYYQVEQELRELRYGFRPFTRQVDFSHPNSMNKFKSIIDRLTNRIIRYSNRRQRERL